MQSTTDLVAIDTLASVIGSRVRADVLDIVNGDPTRVWTAIQVGAASRRHKNVVERELRRLAAIGVIRAISADRKRLYAADQRDPVSRELARFVRQTRGPIPSMRRALAELRSPALAWLGCERVTSAAARPLASPPLLVVLTSAPRSLVRIQLARSISSDTKIECMSVREWVARLNKGDMLTRHLRRGPKQWVVGSWEELVGRERAQVESQRTLRAALSSWRDELSDEWDEDWDPAPDPPAMPR